MPNEAQYIKGIAALGVAAVLSKLLGTLQKIPLQNFAGDGVYGIYNAVYPLYTVILIAATAGFPVAVSKYIADAKAAGEPDRELQRILHMASVMLCCAGALGFLMLYFGAPAVSRWIGNTSTEAALRSIAYSLLVVPILAALRGYFQGLQDMIPTSVSQVIEQLIRVTTIFVLLFYGLDRGANDSWIAAGATFGSVTGAAAGLAIILLYRRRERLVAERSPQERVSWLAAVKPRRKRWTGIRGFAAYSISVSIGLLAMPLLNVADVFTVPRLLAGTGLEESEAMVRFGVFSRGLPLIQLVTMIATSVSVAVIPAVVDAVSRRDTSLVRQRAEAVVQGSWVIGSAASVGMALLAGSLNHMFFANGEGTTAMAIHSFAALFGTVYVMSSGVLQGLGAEKLPVVHLAAAGLLKVSMNVWAVPRFGIEGAAAATVAAYAAACLLNAIQVKLRCGVSYTWMDYAWKPLAALAGMSMVVWTVRLGLLGWLEPADGGNLSRWSHTLISLLGVLSGGIMFIWSCYVLRLDKIRRAVELVLNKIKGRLEK
jgi:O-antigen/teichoic acid export membrane protein